MENSVSDEEEHEITYAEFEDETHIGTFSQTKHLQRLRSKPSKISSPATVERIIKPSYVFSDVDYDIQISKSNENVQQNFDWDAMFQSEQYRASSSSATPSNSGSSSLGVSFSKNSPPKNIKTFSSNTKSSLTRLRRNSSPVQSQNVLSNESKTDIPVKRSRLTILDRPTHWKSSAKPLILTATKDSQANKKSLSLNQRTSYPPLVPTSSKSMASAISFKPSWIVSPVISAANRVAAEEIEEFPHILHIPSENQRDFNLNKSTDNEDIIASPYHHLKTKAKAGSLRFQFNKIKRSNESDVTKLLSISSESIQFNISNMTLSTDLQDPRSRSKMIIEIVIHEISNEFSQIDDVIEVRGDLITAICKKSNSNDTSYTDILGKLQLENQVVVYFHRTAIRNAFNRYHQCLGSDIQLAIGQKWRIFNPLMIISKKTELDQVECKIIDTDLCEVVLLDDEN